MVIGSVEMLDHVLAKHRVVALYGYGAIGSWIYDYGVRFFKENKFTIIDDNKKTGLSCTLKESDRRLACVIVCNTRASARVSMKAQASEHFLDAEIYVTNDYLEYELYKKAHVRPRQADVLRWNLELFESNCFLDALKSGLYRDDKIDFFYKKKVADSYAYLEVCVKEGDIVCDGGALFYDDNEDFIKHALERNASKVVAFEPHPKSFAKIVEVYGENSKVAVKNAALGSEQGSLYLSNNVENNASCNASGVGERIDALTIDSVFLDSGLDFLKLDIEGFEMEALKGAVESIKKYKPKLAICLYHKLNDPYDIPTFIKSLVPEYKMWMVSNEGQYWIGTKLFAKVD